MPPAYKTRENGFLILREVLIPGRVPCPLPPAYKTRENGFLILREVFKPGRVSCPLPPAYKTRENGFLILREVLIPGRVPCPLPTAYKTRENGFWHNFKSNTTIEILWSDIEELMLYPNHEETCLDNNSQYMSCLVPWFTAFGG